MRQIALLILLIALVGCHKNDVAPELPANDLLYRSWQLTQAAHDGKEIVVNPTLDVVTFPRSGNFREDLPDDGGGCCGPSRFEGNNGSIRFVYQSPNFSCANVICRLSPFRGDVTWQIMVLTESSLTLTSGNNRLELKPTP